jgi:hypothetical protein
VYDPSFWSGTLAVICFVVYIDDTVVYLAEGRSDVFCRIIASQMPDNGFNRFRCRREKDIRKKNRIV